MKIYTLTLEEKRARSARVMARYRRLRAAGLCCRCPALAVPGRCRCAPCAARNRNDLRTTLNRSHIVRR